MGVTLNCLQMGIFTELSILYSKYKPEKRTSPIRLYVLGDSELTCY